MPQTGEEASVSPIGGMVLISVAVLMWIARKRLFVRR
ncbi:LPXTG cell wall anchor domain-containing protein [Paenibacillus alvei]